MHSRIIFSIAISLLIAVSSIPVKQPQAKAADSDYKCKPTRPDMEGPFYEPGAPVRSSVGKGYMLQGKVLSAGDCRPISGARIELWQTGPDGNYDDDHRATVFSKETGAYSFESNMPRGYSGRRPHIHMRISAEGFERLTTQHYPQQGNTSGTFDLVLIPRK